MTLINFNLPPWLVTKKHFVILAMIMSEPKCVNAKNIDIFLELLVDELMQLWQYGTKTRDVASYGG